MIPASDIALGRELGRGGMGTVRAATWLGLPVAVKTLVDGDRSKHEQLEQEAALLASLRHPCVCQFFGTCVFDSGPAVVMELLNCSLHELISGPSRIPAPLCLRLAHETAQGIAFLHRNNVLHRVQSARIQSARLCLARPDLTRARSSRDGRTSSLRT